MSKSNENNRPQNSLRLGAISATVEIGLLRADKRILLEKVSITDISLIAASGSNFIEAQLKKNGTLIGSLVDTQAGLAARAKLVLNLGTDADKDLAKGDYLSLQLTKQGTGALTEAGCDMDLNVKGN